MDDVEHPHQMLPAATNVTNQSPQIEFSVYFFSQCFSYALVRYQDKPTCLGLREHHGLA